MSGVASGVIIFLIRKSLIYNTKIITNWSQVQVLPGLPLFNIPVHIGNLISADNPPKSELDAKIRIPPWDRATSAAIARPRPTPLP